MKVFFLILLGFETQAKWLRAHKDTSPVLERPWLEKKITKHSRDRRESAPSDHSGLVLKEWLLSPPSNLLTHTQRTTKIEGLRQADSHSKEGKRASMYSLSVLPSKLQPVAHTPSFSFLFSHHIPLLHCDSRSAVRERLALAVTFGSPGSGNPATRPRAFPGTTSPGLRGSSRPPSQVPPRRMCYQRC